MEPTLQAEIQLGHLCNNRCVFCVSGQLTSQGRARAIPAEPVIRELDAARARGATRITFLGGEPTVQKSFPAVLRHATTLGFDEIVIFTNGVMTPRAGFLDTILPLGDFTWRFSIQGATESHHDAVTKRKGSFARIIQSMQLLRESGQRITANMCITTDNVESLPYYPDLVAEHGIQQLHLDQIRPADAGERDDAHLAAIMPRYGQQAPYLRAMLEGFTARLGPDYDVNVGNLPYCVLPAWSHRIHHDGQRTWTVAATSDGLTEAFDKYAVKRADKSHPAACGGCLFRDRCNGLFEDYQRLFGVDEVRAVTAEDLHGSPAEHVLLPWLLEADMKRLADAVWPSGWSLRGRRSDETRGWLDLSLRNESHPDRAVTLRVRAARPSGEDSEAALVKAGRLEIVERGGLEWAGASLGELAEWIAGELASTPSVTGAWRQRLAGLQKATRIATRIATRSATRIPARVEAEVTDWRREPWEWVGTERSKLGEMTLRVQVGPDGRVGAKYEVHPNESANEPELRTRLAQWLQWTSASAGPVSAAVQSQP